MERRSRNTLIIIIIIIIIITRDQRAVRCCFKNLSCIARPTSLLEAAGSVQSLTHVVPLSPPPLWPSGLGVRLESCKFGI